MFLDIHLPLNRVPNVLFVFLFCFRYKDAQLQETADSFEASGGIPGIVGAIDGILIQIRAPLHDSESYVCKKKFYALQLQVVSE